MAYNFFPSTFIHFISLIIFSYSSFILFTLHTKANSPLFTWIFSHPKKSAILLYSDSENIIGEIMKGFWLKRKVEENCLLKLKNKFSENFDFISD